MSSSIKDLLDYNIVKKCSKCNNVQIISNFYFRKDTNKYRNCCKSCQYEMYKTNIENKKEEIAIYLKNYRQLNKEQLSLKQKEYNERNKDIIRKKKQEYTKNNREQLNNYYNNRRKNDPTFKLTDNLRSRTRAAFKSKNVNKNNKTFELIGCCQKFLRDWIENQLYGEMTMENYGQVWQIDHALPITSFNLFKEDELRKCFNWRNLRPMYSKENMSKGDKVDQRLYLLQEIKAHYFEKLNGETVSD